MGAQMNDETLIPERVYNVMLNLTSIDWWLTRDQQEWFPPLLWKGIKWSYLLVGLGYFKPELLKVLAWPIALME
jgi:hypothetical protein